MPNEPGMTNLGTQAWFKQIKFFVLIGEADRYLISA